MKTREIDGAELKGGGYAALSEGDGPHPDVVVHQRLKAFFGKHLMTGS